MKKFFFSMLLLLFSVATVRAQQDVVRFLDIPVDGSKAAMVAKLKAKGFKSSLVGDLEGQFNGRKVWLNILTNRDKVYRIVMYDAVSLDEGEIRIRFNQLCNQFGKNSKYVGDADAYKIPKDEDISYQIRVKGKRYEAAFGQRASTEESASFKKEINAALLATYTEKDLVDPEKKAEIEEFRRLIKEEILIQRTQKKSVWFMISESAGEYRIAMYYDNGYNMPDGEDL